jgi:hypothetical protein
MLGVEDGAHPARAEDGAHPVLPAHGPSNQVTGGSARSRALTADGFPGGRAPDLLEIVRETAMATSDEPLAHSHAFERFDSYDTLLLAYAVDAHPANDEVLGAAS